MDCRTTVFLLSLLTGCGAGMGGNPTDAGPAGAVNPPAPPVPPTLTPCGTGWRTLSDPAATNIMRCDPWADDSGQATCAADQMQWLGHPACETVGTSCPTDWPTGVPPMGTVYVDDSAAAGGDGTMARPLSSIAAALSIAPDNATIAIASGTYDEVIGVSRGITLMGACTQGTQLTATSTGPEGVVSLTGTSASVQNLTIHSDVRPGMLAQATTSTITDVVVAGARTVGISVQAGSATLTRVVVRDVQAGSDGLYGYGVSVGRGASATLTQVALLHDTTAGLAATDAMTHVQGSDVIASQTQMQPMDSRFGHGVLALNGATMVIDGAALDHNLSAGAFAYGAGAQLTLRNARITETAPQSSDGTFGQGASAAAGASLSLGRSWVTGSAASGLASIGAGSHLEATDVIVRDSRGQMDGRLGAGVHVYDGASATLMRVDVGGSHTAGLIADGSSVDIQDLVLAGTSFQTSDMALGDGLLIYRGATVALTRARVDGAYRSGVTVQSTGTSAVLNDLRVNGVLAQQRDGAFGLGASVENGATLTITRVVVTGAALADVRAFGAGQLTLTDLLVSTQPPGGCPTCAAFGLLSQSGPTTVTRFFIEDVSQCGVVVDVAAGGGPPTLDLESGTVSTSGTGLCQQVGGAQITANAVNYDAVTPTGRASGALPPDLPPL